MRSRPHLPFILALVPINRTCPDTLTKYFLFLLSLLFLPVSSIYSADDKWIDGIKFRGTVYDANSFILAPEFNNEKLVEPPEGLSLGSAESEFLFPVVITFPETLMNSWSFRSFFIDFQLENTVYDLQPPGENIYETSGSTCTLYSADGTICLIEIPNTYKTDKVRQGEKLRDYLYKDFFNDTERSFADANSEWAVSADFTSSRIFLGYLWGVFIPAFEYHRFLKIGLGLALYQADISFKLNLCSTFHTGVTYKNPNSSDGNKKPKRSCDDKTEIDSASAVKSGLAGLAQITIWERYTEDSVWTLIKYELGRNSEDISNFQLKNRDNKLAVRIETETLEILSYTYRF